MCLIKTLRQSTLLPRSLQTAKDTRMMLAPKKTASLFRMFALTVCLFPVLLMSAAAQDSGPVNYTFEKIEVPGVDFLAVTASSDTEDYAGYTRNADGKEVAFTLIDGVFKTYDFPGSQKTHFYALDNEERAAGHYMDSDGLYHGVLLLNGELQQRDFPNSVQTEIYGLNDEGALTGNFIDAEGVRRGFSLSRYEDRIIEAPGATATFADFLSNTGVVAGSYIDADGIYRPYGLLPTGDFLLADFTISGPLQITDMEYFFLHGLTDKTIAVARGKAAGDVPRTYVGTLGVLHEVQVPDAVSTEGWNINNDESIVGYYDTDDGRRYGFHARPMIDDGPDTFTGTYVFESIDVPGVDFLEVTASSDFEDYAGNTRSADGKKTVGFTLIDGVFKTYDFPGSKNTFFYALGNNGNAAGHYEDSDGLFHGVVLENGKLRQYDFPGSVQTFLRGISDATGALTGDFIDANGIRRGFSGDLLIEVPGAVETYADFINAEGVVVGSFVNADGMFSTYVRIPNGDFVIVPGAPHFEYIYHHGINDAGLIVSRIKAPGNAPLTVIGTFAAQAELKVPGSVSTEGWNVNQDGSIVGNYVSHDGRRHGFIARPASKEVSDHFGGAYSVLLPKGLNMISVPLKPFAPMNAKALAGLTGSTTVIKMDTAKQRFVGWTPDAPNDGFAIEGGKGYIVNVPTTRNFAFVGAPWTDPVDTAPGAPPLTTAETLNEAWAFVVSGHLKGRSALDGYRVVVRNARTNETISAPVHKGYFAAATADLSRRSVVEAGDAIELRVVGPDGNIESQTFRFDVTSEHLANAVLPVTLYGVGKPAQNRLLQNYPNPFNPETWIPYQLAEDSEVSISIYDSAGRLVRSLSLGYQPAGFYNSRGQAAYWDGRNAVGESAASGVYFYQLETPSFRQTRRLLILK